MLDSLWRRREEDNKEKTLKKLLQVTLADESIVLYMCEGKVLMDIIRSNMAVDGRAWRLALLEGNLHPRHCACLQPANWLG